MVLEASSTMEEEEGEGTATLLASAADRPTTGVVVVVDQGTASRDKRWDFNLSASSKEGLGIEVKVKDLFR